MKHEPVPPDFPSHPQQDDVSPEHMAFQNTQDSYGRGPPDSKDISRRLRRKDRIKIMIKELHVKELLKQFLSSKYLIVLALVGAILILLPTGSTQKNKPASAQDIAPPEFSLEAQEEKIKEAVESIDGVGKVRVILSLKGGVARDIAFEDNTALVVSAGSGTQRAVETRYLYPEYQGAVVICEGGELSRVRLDVTQAVSSLTGLSSNKITVTKMKKS